MPIKHPCGSMSMGAVLLCSDAVFASCKEMHDPVADTVSPHDPERLVLEDKVGSSVPARVVILVKLMSSYVPHASQGWQDLLKVKRSGNISRDGRFVHEPAHRMLPPAASCLAMAVAAAGASQCLCVHVDCTWMEHGGIHRVKPTADQGTSHVSQLPSFLG